MGFACQHAGCGCTPRSSRRRGAATFLHRACRCAWKISPTTQDKWTCGAGRRNADASECFAAWLPQSWLQPAERLQQAAISSLSTAWPCCPVARTAARAVMTCSTQLRGSFSQTGKPTSITHSSASMSLLLYRLLHHRRRRRRRVCPLHSARLGVCAGPCLRPSASDQRNAAACECLIAVRGAVPNVGLEVGNLLKEVNDDSISSGCSYSHVSSKAIFNNHPAGGDSINYALVCEALEDGGGAEHHKWTLSKPGTRTPA